MALHWLVLTVLPTLNNATKDGSRLAQAAAPLQYTPPGPHPGPGQVLYQSPYNMGYYKNQPAVFNKQYD